MGQGLGRVEELGNLGAEPASQACPLSLGMLLGGELIEAGAVYTGGYFNSQVSHNETGCSGGVQMEMGEHILRIHKTYP